MFWVAGVASWTALAFVPTGAKVDPPPNARLWVQLGAAPLSRPGKALHFYRTAQNPRALAFVVTSTSGRPIHVFWSTYCEVIDDDAAFEEHQGTLDGVGHVIAYPSVLDGSTTCFLWVNANLGKGDTARVSAAIFDY